MNSYSSKSSFKIWLDTRTHDVDQNSVSFHFSIMIYSFRLSLLRQRLALVSLKSTLVNWRIRLSCTRVTFINYFHCILKDHLVQFYKEKYNLIIWLRCTNFENKVCKIFTLKESSITYSSKVWYTSKQWCPFLMLKISLSPKDLWRSGKI